MACVDDASSSGDDLDGTLALGGGGEGGDRERVEALAGLLEGANVLIKHHDVSDFDIDATVALLGDAASTVQAGRRGNCSVWRPKGWGWLRESLRAYPRRPWRTGGERKDH